MPKFLIERDIPNVGSLSAEEMRAVSQTSCNTLQHLGPSVQWVQSFVTDNEVYCVYIAPNAEMIRNILNIPGFLHTRSVRFRELLIRQRQN